MPHRVPFRPSAFLLPLLLVAGVFSLPGTAANAQALAADSSASGRLEVGTLGAAFATDRWERAKLAANVGKDQFQAVEGEHYLFAFELFGLYDERASFEAQLQAAVDNIQKRHAEAEIDPQLGFERYDGFIRASRQVKVSENGLDLGYQLDLLSSGDGVGYLLISWSEEKFSKEHQVALEEIVDSYAPPGEGSEWRAKTVPAVHSYQLGKWKVQLTFADSIFAQQEVETPERRNLEGDQGRLGFHVIVEGMEGGADEGLDQILELVADDGPYEELTRTDIVVAGRPGRQVLARGGGDPVKDLAVAVAQLEPGVWLDLRLVSVTSFGSREAIWQSLLASLAVEREAEIDAFPVAAPAAGSSAEEFPGEAARRLFEGSQLLAPAGWVAAVEPLAGGGVIVQDGRRILVARPGAPGEAAQSEVLVASGEGESFSGGALVWGERTLLAGTGEEVRMLEGGKLVPAGFRADLLTLAGEDLLLARSAERRSMPGFGELPVAGPSGIYLRRSGGEERKVAELADRRVDALAYRAGKILLAAAPRGRSARSQRPLVELAEIDAKSGQRRELERFVEVRRIAPAPSGWLVSGRDAAGEDGLFLLAGDGRRELLMRGELTGIALDGEALIFSVRFCSGTEAGTSGSCVYRAPLALVRREGPFYAAIDARRLNAIAAAATTRAGLADALSAFPSTRGGAAAYFAAAEALAREQAGAALPAGAAEVDAFFYRLAGEDQLDEKGHALLAVIVAEQLLREGAVWVAPEGGAPLVPSRTGLEVQNPFAIGVVPLGLTASLLSEDNGWYEPVEALQAYADGRQILIGPDRQALRAAVRAAEPAGFDALIRQGGERELRALLEGARGNLALRQHVYRQLAALGRDEELAQVSGAFAAAADARRFDRVAWAAALLASPPGGKLAAEEAEKLVASLRDGIAADPETAELYLLLGAAYEATAREDRAAYARAAYRRTAEIQEWGATGQAAQEALARLGDTP